MTFMFFGLQHVSIGFAFARLWRHSDSRGLQTTTSNNVYSIYIYIIKKIYIYINNLYIIYIYRYSCNVFMPSNQTYFKFGLSVAQAPTVGCWCNSRYCRLFAVFVILFAMGHLARLGSAWLSWRCWTVTLLQDNKVPTGSFWYKHSNTPHTYRKGL